LAGKVVILAPRTGLKRNEYLVEEGKFINGAPTFSLYCLVCDKQISSNGCDVCER